MTKITIGARGSKLSLAYVAKVRDLLLKEIFDRISAVPLSFSLITAAAVSSQLVSIPKKVSFFIIVRSLIK